MDSGLSLRSPRNDERIGAANASPHRPLSFELPLGHHAIAAALLGLVERAVAAVDQIFHSLAGQELADADRHGDPRQFLTGGAAGNLAVGERVADAPGNRGTYGEIRAREERDQLLPPPARRPAGVAG